MNADTDPDLRLQLARLARTIQFGFCTLLFGVSYFNIGAAFVLIPHFAQSLHDALGGKPLPPVSAFVESYHWALLALSIAMPVAGVAMCRFTAPARSLITISVLVVAAAIQTEVTWFALITPVCAIDYGTMSSGAP